MRIAVSADDKKGLDSIVSPHFGRCPYYILIDLTGNQVDSVSEVDNPNYGSHAPGLVPSFINDHGANVMIAGGMGRRAIDLFQQYGIKAVTGAYGTIRQALEQFLGGALQDAEPCLTSQGHGQEVYLPEPEYEQDEIGRLREEFKMLEQQIAEAEKRFGKL